MGEGYRRGKVSVTRGGGSYREAHGGREQENGE